MNFSSEGLNNNSNTQTRTADYWTPWFNVDRPWVDDGDTETVGRIQSVVGSICENGYQICASLCRVEATGQVFNQETPISNRSDIFEVACTTQGLVCKNSAQLPGAPRCEDYSIRFRCHYKDADDNSNYFSQLDIRIYVILALIPVLLFLFRWLWVYIHKRNHQRPAGNGTSSGDTAPASTSSSALAQPPPSYHELFGKSSQLGQGSSMFAISRENIQICFACRDTPCSISLIIGNKSGESSQNSDVRSRCHGCTENNLEPALETVSCVGAQGETQLRELAQAPTLGVTSELDDADIVVETTSRHQQNENSSIHGPRDVHIQTDAAITKRQISQPATRWETTCDKSLAPFSLNQPVSRLRKVSQPCDCDCHRTVPSKHQGTTGCVNYAYDNDTSNSNASKHPALPNLHMPIFHQNVDSESSSPTSASGLPSYEDALDFIKVKKHES